MIGPKDKPEPEGEISVTVTEKDGCVLINFGKPIVWVALHRDQALELCRVIMKHSNCLKLEIVTQ